MRILVVSQFFIPDVTAAAFRLADHARLFADAGHEVRVLTAAPHKAQVDAERELEHENVRIFRTNVRAVKVSTTAEYLRHYLSFVRGSIWEGIKHWLGGWKPDVIYVSSPPLFVGLTGRFLSMLYRRPMVFEVRDIWPDSAVAAEMISKQGRAYRFGRRLERYLYRKASHIVCVARPMCEYIQGQTDTPVTVAYNGVPGDRVRADSAHRAPQRDDSAKTIMYAGNFGHVQDCDVLLRAFDRVVDEGKLSGWRLRLIGAGAQKENLVRLREQLPSAKLILIEEPLSRERVFCELRDADVLYLNLKKDETLAKTIPSKVFDYMLAARPILAGLIGEGRDILESNTANVCCDPSDLDALCESLCDVDSRFDQMNQAADENRRLVMNSYTRENAVRTLLEVFESIVPPAKPS